VQVVQHSIAAADCAMKRAVIGWWLAELPWLHVVMMGWIGSVRQVRSRRYYESETTSATKAPVKLANETTADRWQAMHAAAASEVATVVARTVER
jgi:hypothetical protein